MEELINKLNEYFETHEGKVYPEEGKTEWLDLMEDDPVLYGELWDNLFTGYYGFNPDTRAALRKSGFVVRATDRDSFGILVACVWKGNKGISLG